MNMQTVITQSDAINTDLIKARYYALEAANYLSIAYHLKANGIETEFYHCEAMAQLDKMAEVLGLELVARENVEGGR